MAKRGGFNDFISAFNQGFDTVNKIGKDYEMSKLMQDKGTAVFNPDQVDQRSTISGAKDENGNPLYTVGDIADGQYQVTSNLPDDSGAPAQPFSIAANGTQYMGKTVDHPMTDSEKASSRNMAMSGIMAKYGDPEGAMRFQDSALRMQRDDKQAAQGDQRFAWDKTRAEREQRQGDQAEADTTALRDIDSKTAANFKKRISNPDGTQRQVTADDLLSVTHEKANLLAQGGYIKEATALTDQYAASVSLKLRAEQAQREAALKSIAPGDYKAVADYYNRFIPDGAQVTSIEPGKNGSLVIKRTQNDGTQLPDKVLAKGDAELSAMLQQTVDSNAMTQFSANEFKNNLLLRADQRAGSAEARAARGETRTNTEKAATVAAGVALFKEQHPNATPAELEAVKTGILAAVPKVDSNAPAEVKLAQAFINAGLDKDMASALRRASNSKNDSPEKFYQDVYKDALKSNFGDSAKAKAVADQAMKDRPEAIAAGSPASTKPANEADALAQAQAAVAKGADKTKVNERLKSQGFKTLD